jgi:hypothetical protein
MTLEEPPREGPRAPVFNLASELLTTVRLTGELVERLRSVSVAPRAQRPSTPGQGVTGPQHSPADDRPEPTGDQDSPPGGQESPPDAPQNPPVAQQPSESCAALQYLVSASPRAVQLVSWLEPAQCEAFVNLVNFVSAQNLGTELRIYERQYATTVDSVREDMLSTFGFPIVESATVTTKPTERAGCWIRFTNPPPQAPGV